MKDHKEEKAFYDEFRKGKEVNFLEGLPDVFDLMEAYALLKCKEDRKHLEGDFKLFVEKNPSSHLLTLNQINEVLYPF